MDLITIILIVGSLVNGVLLTLCLRHAREAVEQIVCARAELHLMSGEVAKVQLHQADHRVDLKTAIAALPKKRRPRKPAEGTTDA